MWRPKVVSRATLEAKDIHSIEQYIQIQLVQNGTLNRNGTLKETGCFQRWYGTLNRNFHKRLRTVHLIEQYA